MGDAAAKATEAAAPKAAEAATPAARRIASMPTRGYEAARDAAMALERKRTYGCIRPVCPCIDGRRADLAATVKELNDEIASLKDLKDVQPLIQDLSRLTLAADSQLAQLGKANTAVDDALRRGATFTMGSMMFPLAGTPLVLRDSVGGPNPPPPPASPPRKPGSCS